MIDHRAEERARDRHMVSYKRNTARFFTENPHVAWVALLATLAWGAWSYLSMAKAKDPVLDIRVAVASCIWPGAEAEKIEQLISRKIEQKLAENANIDRIDSISRTGAAIVYVLLKEDVTDRAKEWDSLQARLASIHDLPEGAGPIQFHRDFGDTATLMLTVASPKVGPVELELRANAVTDAIKAVRTGARIPKDGMRATIVISFPADINVSVMRRSTDRAIRYFDALPGTSDARTIERPGFIAIDVATTLDDKALIARLTALAESQMRVSELHPDVWVPTVIRNPIDTRARLTAVAGSRYSHRELDRATDQIRRYLLRAPLVAKVTRSGVLPEQIHLEYSQERLASYGLKASLIGDALAARNITAPGGVIDVGGKNVSIDPSGELTNEQQIGDIVVTTSAAGSPVYLRDLVEVSRDYQSPARFLNFLTTRDDNGRFVRSRAITLAVNMRRGEQVSEFGEQIDAELATVTRLLPEDLVIRRTSDQPLQVRENVGLFVRSLCEAMALIVLVALIGFWDLRTAMMLALCIPITLAMTFGMMHMLGVELQQISIASLIIALGLLIDDPVVASDAIKNSLAAGWKARVAAWLGPTKLATAIVFATLTNIAAYLPFLTMPGDVGTFIRSLPLVIALSLIASRIVSITFVPMLGALLLRSPVRPPPSPDERRRRGFGRVYCAITGWAIDHRALVLILSLALIGGAAFYARKLKSGFFPKDLSYLSYVDIWLPADATLGATRSKAVEVSRAIEAGVAAWSTEHGRKESTLASITEFDGAGGPRFWFSVSPELPQLNYAQLVIQLRDKHDTRFVVPYLQERIARTVAGARVDFRELEIGKAVGIPIAMRFSGEDIAQLRQLAERGKALLRATPGAARVRDDWGADTFAVKLRVDPDRANLANVTNLDVAQSSASAMTGALVGRMREDDREIPIIARLRPEERAQISEIENLYVHARDSAQKVPLGQVSRVTYSLQTERIRRRNQFRTITVSAFPAPGMLASQVVKAAKPAINELRKSMPSDYRFELVGEDEQQNKSFRNMGLVLALMLGTIYIALVVQFRNAVKPMIVFFALPFGAAAAVVGLVAMNSPFNFMAALGIISLMGVIVSHIIVLFDFIEDMQQRGMPLRQALLDAGLMRLRPVLLTVVATVLGLVPLAMHGGPLWEPLCYAQIGGLLFATVVTLLLVPVIYTIAVEDLGLIRWERPHQLDAWMSGQHKIL